MGTRTDLKNDLDDPPSFKQISVIGNTKKLMPILSHPSAGFRVRRKTTANKKSDIYE